MKISSRPLENSGVVCAILTLLTLFVAAPLFIDGWFWTHEELSPVGRVIALTEEMRNGDFYPRWLSQTYRGKGSPFFNFYSPFFHFIAAYLHLAGLSLLASLKIPLCLLFFTGAWGVYLWIRRHCGGAGGAIAAVLYLFTPYHFVDIYVRGALAEFSALAVLPYLFYGIDLLIDKPEKRKGFIVTVASTAMILLCHQLSAIMIAPFALLYSLTSLVSSGFSLRKFLLLLAVPIVAAGFSAFYWLPVLAEKQFLRDFTGAVLRGEQSEYYYADHFVHPSQWFSTFWGFGNSVKGTGDTMSFQIGIVLLSVAGIALLAMCISKHGRDFFTLQLLLLGTFAIALTSGYSMFVYQLAPPLAFVQFPWRFLGPASLFIAGCGGTVAISPFIGRFPLIILSIVIVASIYFSIEHRKVYLPNVDILPGYETTQLKMRMLAGLNAENEYLPKSADRNQIGDLLEVSPMTASGTVTDLVVENKKMRFTVNGAAPDTQVAIPWYDFPGWKGKVDGQSVMVTPTIQGYLQLTVPAGTHIVELFFGTTWSRVTGWSVAGVTAVILAVIMRKSRSKKRKGV